MDLSTPGAYYILVYITADQHNSLERERFLSSRSQVSFAMLSFNLQYGMVSAHKRRRR